MSWPTSGRASFTGIDTNILFLATVGTGPTADGARRFLAGLATDPDVAVSELVLLEYYILLRNPAVVARPLGAAAAVSTVQGFRRHPRWAVVDHDPAVMAEVWNRAAEAGFARRRVFDLRLALSLRRHGVRRFANRNVRDFEGLGFEHVWDPTAS